MSWTNTLRRKAERRAAELTDLLAQRTQVVDEIIQVRRHIKALEDVIQLEAADATAAPEEP